MTDITPQYTIEQIEDAYRRLKHFIYYDNNFLHYRMKIAEFESGLDEDERDLSISIIDMRLSQLCSRLNETDLNIEDWLEKIAVFPIPKSVSQNKDEGLNNDKKDCQESTIIHNAQPDGIIVEKVTWLIDVPIEIHIISVLWTLQFGYELQSKYKKSNFGNLLQDNMSSKEKAFGLNLFSPYHLDYQKWRDGAIKKAKALISEGDDVLMIGLDVRDYFHSIRLSESDYNPPMQNEGLDHRLGEILFDVSKHYFRNVIPNFPKKTKNTYGLPIGLISSRILSNWYLSDFDNDVLNKLQPTYYKRYVDDILIVIKCHKKCKNSEDISKAANIYLSKILSEKDEKCQRTILAKKSLSIQNSKVTLYYFDADEPITLLEKFIQEIRHNSSEFRFLPTEEEAKMEFQEAAFSINYDGSKMKLRSIKDFTPNHFGVSTYLAKLIFTSIRVNEKINKETANQVCTFFRGSRAIDFYQYWEKAFTYFVVTKNINAIKKLEKNIQSAIAQIETISDLKDVKIKETLEKHLHLSKSMALSLHPLKEFEDTTSSIIKLRESNLIRHNYVCSPLVNYLDLNQNENWSYIDFDAQKNENINNENLINIIRVNSWKFSPRFVHFHEISLLWLDRHLINPKQSTNTESNPIIPFDYLKQIFKIFYHVNHSRTKPETSDSDLSLNAFESHYFSSENLRKTDELTVQNIIVNAGEEIQNVRIALANLVVSGDDVKASYLNKPNLTVKRRDKLYSILNQVEKQGKADILILPEASIPYRWTTLLCDQVKRNNMATVFGLEHWIKDGFAYNILVTLLPVKISARVREEDPETFDAVIPVFRIKNHYSPDEIEELEGYHHKIPQPKPHFYHLFNWRGLKFTTFNCFELADISHRSVFRSKIDFMIACEFNSDVNYFSNIAESASRDLHCFFIQANSADYGDSRITQPVKTESKDIVRIKGGVNPIAVIDCINVKKLREFQYKQWNLQLQDKSFKPTPPGFDKEDVEQRLGLNVIKSTKK